MEMSAIVPAVLAGMSSGAVLLPGMWRMLAHYEKRNEKAHGDLRDAITSTATQLEKRNEKAHGDLRDVITSTATRLGSRIEKRFDRLETRLDQMDERLRNVEQAFAQVDQRLETLERVVLPSGNVAQWRRAREQRPLSPRNAGS